MKDSCVVRLCFGMFFVIGLIFTVIGACQAMSLEAFLDRAVEVEGVYSEVGTETRRIKTKNHSRLETYYYAYVDYSYNGQEYEHIFLDSVKESRIEGRACTIYVDPKKPTNIKSDSVEVFPFYIMAALGSIFLIIGGFALFSMAKNGGKRKRLMLENNKVRAVVTGIETVQNVRINGVRPMRVCCEYLDEVKNEKFSFKSEMINPSLAEGINAGDIVDVYVDYYDYSNYYVDVENGVSEKL